MNKIAKKLLATPLYEGHGEESDLPEDAAEEIARLESLVEELKADRIRINEEAETEITRLRAEAERLRVALEEEQRLRKSIITLLFTDEVFVGSNWADFPNAEVGVSPQLCAQVRSYGADAEPIADDEIIPLAELVTQFGDKAIAAWVCFKRGEDKPPKSGLGEDGEMALAFLRKSRAESGE